MFRVRTILILSVTKYSFSELYKHSEDWSWSEDVPSIYEINNRRSPLESRRYNAIEERSRTNSVGEWRWRDDHQNRNELKINKPKPVEKYQVLQSNDRSLDEDYLMKWMKSYVERIKRKRGFNLDRDQNREEDIDHDQIPLIIGEYRREEPGVTGRGRAGGTSGRQEWRWRERGPGGPGGPEVVIHMKRNRDKSPRIASNR